jgi:hypothetical protein
MKESASGDLKIAKFEKFLVTVREQIEIQTSRWYH